MRIRSWTWMACWTLLLCSWWRVKSTIRVSGGGTVKSKEEETKRIRKSLASKCISGCALVVSGLTIRRTSVRQVLYERSGRVNGTRSHGCVCASGIDTGRERARRSERGSARNDRELIASCSPRLLHPIRSPVRSTRVPYLNFVQDIGHRDRL